MNTQKIAPNWDWSFKKFNAAPFILKFYLIFSCVVTIADLLLYIFYRDKVLPKIIPITGWSSTTFYMFTLFFSFAIIFANPLVIQKVKMRSAIVRLFCIGIAFGVIDYFLFYNNDSQNSYIQVSVFRPVWTMVLPTIWIILLMLPQVTKFCEQKNN